MASSLPNLVHHTDPADLAHDLGRQVWTGTRSAAPWGVHGLNAEAAVRSRLSLTLRDLIRHVADRRTLEAIEVLDVAHAAPLDVLNRTESLVRIVYGERHESVDAIVHDTDYATRLVSRLLIVQSIAGRLGHWAVRGDEIRDARTAHALTKDLGAIDWSHYCTLVDRGARCFDASEFRQAALAYLAADRLVRTPVGLIHASACLCQVGDYVGALWAIRACLLEPESAFEGDDQLARSRTLERRLTTLLQGRHAEPMDVEEVDLIGGDTHDSLPRDPEDDIVIDEEPPILLDELEPDPNRLTRLVVEDRWALVTPNKRRWEAEETKRVRLRVQTEVRPLTLFPAVTDERAQLIADTFDGQIPAEVAHHEADLYDDQRVTGRAEANDFEEPTEVQKKKRDPRSTRAQLALVLAAADAVTSSERAIDPLDREFEVVIDERPTETATEQLAFEHVPIHGRIADTAEIDRPRVLDQRKEVTQLIRTLRRTADEPGIDGSPRV